MISYCPYSFAYSLFLSQTLGIMTAVSHFQAFFFLFWYWLSQWACIAVGGLPLKHALTSLVYCFSKLVCKCTETAAQPHLKVQKSMECVAVRYNIHKVSKKISEVLYTMISRH